VARTRSRLVVLLAGLGLVVGGLVVGGPGPAHAVAGAKVFAGSGFGPIPDGGNACSPSPGVPLDVTFDVSGMGAARPGDVRVTGLSVAHTFLGDLTVTLIAPDGSQKALFGRTGAITAGGLGDNSNVAGPYTFADDAAGNWWSAASAANDSTAIPSGSYRTSGVGGDGSGNPAPGSLTQLTPAFAGVTHPNGTWTLRFVDTCGLTTGTVAAATLELVPGPCAMEAEAKEAAQAKVTAADAAVTPAKAEVTKADLAVQSATAAVAGAEKAVDKAKKKLKKAKESGAPGKIDKAKAKLKKAKKALKKAKATLVTAQQSAAAAHQKLTTATAAASTARAELGAAEHEHDQCLAAL